MLPQYAYMLSLYTVSKKTCQHTFCSVLIEYQPISIKIGRHVLEETLKTQKLPTSFKICASTTLENMK